MKNFCKLIVRKIVVWNLYIYCKLVHRVKIEGRENIPKEGALIFCGNHKSFLDPPLIQITVKRKSYFLAKADLYKNCFFRILGWAFDAIPVKRDSKDINAIKTSLKHLKNGDCIAIFPEGTRNGIEKGEKVKDGAAFFAQRSGAKVVPIGISGNSKGFGKVKIKYGKPLDFSKYDKDDKGALEKITQEIMNAILELTE